MEGCRFSFSTCHHVRRAARRLLLDKKDILSLGVHFTADKKRRPPSHSCPIVQELCESRGGRPGLSVLTSLLVSVDVKNY